MPVWSALSQPRFSVIPSILVTPTAPAEPVGRRDALVRSARPLTLPVPDNPPRGDMTGSVVVQQVLSHGAWGVSAYARQKELKRGWQAAAEAQPVRTAGYGSLAQPAPVLGTLLDVRL